MSAPSTQLQERIMRAMAVVSARKLRRRESAVVSTADLSEELGRAGQVLGHSCGELLRKGMVTRPARATYRLTRAGVEWVAGSVQ